MNGLKWARRHVRYRPPLQAWKYIEARNGNREYDDSQPWDLVCILISEQEKRKNEKKRGTPAPALQ